MNTFIEDFQTAVDPIYLRMQQELAKEIEDFDNFSVFRTLIGEKYIPATQGNKTSIAFYGRANNGWDDEDHDGIEILSTYRPSPFFSMISDIAKTFYPVEDYYQHVIWSNVCKCTPINGGNPSADMWDKQYWYMTEILQKELDLLAPKVAVFITGIQEHLRWDWPLFEQQLNLDPTPIMQKSWHEEKKECSMKLFLRKASFGNQYIIVTGRPELNKPKLQAATICNTIESIANNPLSQFIDS